MLNPGPFFSIVLPTYNRANFVSKAIQSVIDQKYPNWELLIIDDGSTDNTKEVIESFKDERIKYHWQENAERSAARNMGIELSSGNFICFLDSDDYFLPKKLSKLKVVIDNAYNKNIFYIDNLLKEDDGEKIQLNNLRNPEDYTKTEWIIASTIFSQQVCSSREVFQKYRFDTRFRIGEDMELWIRIAGEFPFVQIDSYQTVIVEHADRSINVKKFNSAFEQLRTLKYIFKQNNSLKVRSALKATVLSNCMFNVAKYWMYQNKKIKALYWLLRCLLTDSRNVLWKHWLYCIVVLVKRKVPNEYCQ